MKSEKILIVDDEPGMLRAAERVLSDTYLVRTAARPSEALDVVQTFAPDLVVCDIRMPEMDGFELVNALRERSPGIDVIFMTGSSAEPEAALVRAIRHQAFFFVQKPFDRQVLLTLVERCMELRRLRLAQRAHTARLERELAAARAVQHALLPAPDALVGGLHISARLQTCQELGGDLFDYATIADNGVAFILADACGHGASAALLTMIVKSAFRAALPEGGRPVDVIERLVDGVAHFGSATFVTAICGRIVDGECEYVNAGHPAALLRTGHAGDAQPLDSTGPIASPAFSPGEWPARQTAFPIGSLLLAYTDGLMEVPRRSPTQIFEHLRALSAGRDAVAAVNAVHEAAIRDLQGAPTADDIALLAVSRGS